MRYPSAPPVIATESTEPTEDPATTRPFFFVFPQAPIRTSVSHQRDKTPAHILVDAATRQDNERWWCGVRGFRGFRGYSISLVGTSRNLPLSLQMRYALRHPLRGIFSFQVMPEPLKDAPLIVDLILLLSQAVTLVGVDE